MTFFTRWHGLRLDGGRDGLGLLPVWTRLARQGIWNITSVAGDLAGWRTLLAAVGIATHGGQPPYTDLWIQQALAAERLIGLSRCVVARGRRVDALRGSDALHQAAARAQANEPVVLGALKILEAQFRTGVFGQIGRPAIRSGLLVEGFAYAPRAANCWDEQVWPRLASHSEEILAVVRGDAPFAVARHRSMAEALADAGGPEPLSDDERMWLDDRILRAGAPDSSSVQEDARQEAPPANVAHCQNSLVDALVDPSSPTLASFGSIDTFLSLAAAVETRSPATATWLRQVAAIESVLGPMDAVFSRVLDAGRASGTRQTVDQVCEAITKRFREYRSERMRFALTEDDWAHVKLSDPARGEAFTCVRSFDEALVAGDPRVAIEAAVERNRQIARLRGAEAWVTLGQRVIEARISTGARAGLPEAGSLVHPYYVGTLSDLIAACHGSRRAA